MTLKQSVWYDRRVRNAEAAGSNPARSTLAPAHIDFDTLAVVLELKKNGLAEDTIEKYSRRLRQLARNTYLKNPEAVKSYISNQESGNANKEANYRTKLTTI